MLINYPTLHRATHGSLTSLTLRFLSGASPKPIPDDLVRAASNLYALLHHTGGKVGAAANWRKSVEDTLDFAWNAFTGLRTTYSPPGRSLSFTSVTPSAELTRVLRPAPAACATGPAHCSSSQSGQVENSYTCPVRLDRVCRQRDYATLTR